MLNSNLEPFADKAGVIAVAVAASISIIIITLFSIFASITIYQYLRQTSLQRLNNATRGSRFLCSTGGFLLLNMLLGDLIEATGFAMNYSWIAQGGIPINPTPLCTAQGVMIQVGDLASTFGSLILGVHIFLILVFSYKPAFRYIAAVVAFFWAIIIVLTTLGPRYLEVDGIPFYGANAGWCWISARYQKEKLWLLYLLVLIVSGINVCLYAIVYATIYRRRLRHVTTSGPDSAAVARILLIYPMIYVVTMTPLAVTRVASINGINWPVAAELAAGVIFTLSGTVNVLVYSTTRKIVSMETVISAFETLRHGSGGKNSPARSINSLEAKPVERFQKKVVGIEDEDDDFDDRRVSIVPSINYSLDPLHPRRVSETPSNFSTTGKEKGELKEEIGKEK